VTRTISISLLEDLLRQAESLATAESRTMSELFREAFRTYRVERIRQQLREDTEYARSLPATPYTEADVEQLIKEDRAAGVSDRQEGRRISRCNSPARARYRLRCIAARAPARFHR